MVVRRARRGFTMLETVLAVAILAVLLAVGFVALFHVRTSMLQMELDATARELYVAAQNHLAAASGQGLLQRVDMGTAEDEGAPESVYYFVYNPDVPESDANNPNNKASTLSLMLPFGSIDETVRTGGSFIVRYQPSTATVLDAFFATTDGFGSHSFSAGEYGDVAALAGEDKSPERRNYGGSVIGWYGGQGTGQAPASFQAPMLEVVNGDYLMVKVTNPNGSRDGQRLRLIVEGAESGCALYFDVVSPDSLLPDAHVKSLGAGSYADSYAVTLDDVTSYGSDAKEQGHFVNVVAERKDAGAFTAGSADSFVPGEDLSIYAWATSATELSAVARSATFTANSLFGVGSAAGGTEPLAALGADANAPAAVASLADQAAGQWSSYAAAVSSFRHLANLDGDVSGFDPPEGCAVTAMQTTDIDWERFPTVDPSAFPGMSRNHDSASVFTHDGARSSAAGTLLPVSPAYPLVYDGLAHWVSNIVVQTGSRAGNAGLFGELPASSAAVATSFRNIELVCPRVTASDAGAAGALAGVAGEGVTVSNVLARDSLVETETAADTNAVVAGGVAGGLVGRAASGVAVNASAAAVRVRAAAGAAGGLVGVAEGALSVADSYAAGHTAGGAYDASDMNVSSAGDAAGGLVGRADTLTAQNCYSTCSAQGSVVGGLIGSAAGGRITNCYATGLVVGPAAEAGADEPAEPATAAGVGAFGGQLGSAELQDDKYLDIVNARQGVKAVDGADAAGVTAIDASVAAYAGFVPPTDAMSFANPYDAGLIARYQYNGKVTYPYRTIGGTADNSLSGTTFPEGTAAEEGTAGLSPQSAVVPFDELQQSASALAVQAEQPDGRSNVLVSHLTTHYGDWPSPETPVVNVRTVT